MKTYQTKALGLSVSELINQNNELQEKRFVMKCFQCKGVRVVIDRMTKSFSVCSFCGGTGKRHFTAKYRNGVICSVSVGSYREEVDD